MISPLLSCSVLFDSLIGIWSKNRGNWLLGADYLSDQLGGSVVEVKRSRNNIFLLPHMEEEQPGVVMDVSSGGTNYEDDVNRANTDEAFGSSGADKGDSGNVANSNGGESGEHGVEVLIENSLASSPDQEHFPLVEKKSVKEKRKKAPKPPRHPHGPSLSPSDIKLVKEISELTVKKRVRMERIKALKKDKANNSSSPSSCDIFLGAMIVTTAFCVVLIIQGIYFRNTPITTTYEGSPEAASKPKGLISVQFSNHSSNERPEQRSELPRAAEDPSLGIRSPG